MSSFNILNHIKLAYKLLGAFVLIALFSGLVGLYATSQMANMNVKVTEVVEINVEQADWSMETIIVIETQLVSIHASMLGESEAVNEFTEADTIMQTGLANLTTLLEGTTRESSISSLKTKYTNFKNTCNDPATGVFLSMNNYKEAKGWADTQFWRLDKLQGKLDTELILLEEMVVDFSAPGYPNATLTNNAMELNLLAWRCIDLARMYMALPLNDSAEYNAERQQLRNEFADAASIAAESKYVISGLEREFTDLLAEAEANYAWAVANGQANSTCTDILADVRDDFVFKAHALGPLYDPVAASIRCPEDGVFVAQDRLVASWVVAETAMETADSLALALLSDFEALEVWVSEQMELAKDAVAQSYKDAVSLVFTVSVIAIVLGSVIGFVFSRSVTVPLSKIVRTSSDVAQGNLSVDLSDIDRSRRDEIGKLGKSFGTMVEKVIGDMVNLINTAREAAERLLTSSEEFASSAEEMNASSEEISSVIQQMNRGAQQQAEQINSTVINVQELSDVSVKIIQDITNTVELITDVASQTNMLALNAAIEAARAGDYGRGFAVVADNVRRLAEDTKQNTANIQELVIGIQHQITANVEKIAKSVDSVAAVAEETAASSEEASAASEEQTATMEEMSAAAQELAQLAEELTATISSFKLKETSNRAVTGTRNKFEETLRRVQPVVDKIAKDTDDKH